MEKTLQQMEKDTCDFFCKAFCGKSAKIVPPEDMDSFSLQGAIEIDSGDKRGVLYIGLLEKEGE